MSDSFLPGDHAATYVDGQRVQGRVVAVADDGYVTIEIPASPVPLIGMGKKVTAPAAQFVRVITTRPAPPVPFQLDRGNPEARITQTGRWSYSIKVVDGITQWGARRLRLDRVRRPPPRRAQGAAVPGEVPAVAAPTGKRPDRATRRQGRVRCGALTARWSARCGPSPSGSTGCGSRIGIRRRRRTGRGRGCAVTTSGRWRTPAPR